MLAKIKIDDPLLEEAKKLGGHRTVREAVIAALNEYVRIKKQMRITSLFGTIDYDPDYDYKRERTRGGKDNDESIL